MCIRMYVRVTDMEFPEQIFHKQLTKTFRLKLPANEFY